MKQSEIFKNVREVIDSDRCLYMCVATTVLHVDDIITIKEMDTTRRIIRERLGLQRSETVRQYLNRMGVLSYSDKFEKDFRLEWLDKIIKEFEEKGD